jgi:hypothetical protein
MAWEKDHWGEMQRVWTSEPSLEAITHLCEVLLEIPAKIKFLAQGGVPIPAVASYLTTTDYQYSSIQQTVHSHFNSIIQILRHAIHPHLKTESEAATLEWFLRETSIPVPRVIALCSNSEYEPVFEWMLMDHMPGTVLADAWGSISWDKRRLSPGKLLTVSHR